MVKWTAVMTRARIAGTLRKWRRLRSQLLSMQAFMSTEGSRQAVTTCHPFSHVSYTFTDSQAAPLQRCVSCLVTRSLIIQHSAGIGLEYLFIVRCTEVACLLYWRSPLQLSSRAPRTRHLTCQARNLQCMKDVEDMMIVCDLQMLSRPEPSRPYCTGLTTSLHHPDQHTKR